MTFSKLTCAERQRLGVGSGGRELALEFLLPELFEPGVALVGFGSQVEEVVVERVDVGRVEFHGETTRCFRFHFVDDVRPHVPAITATKPTS